MPRRLVQRISGVTHELKPCQKAIAQSEMDRQDENTRRSELQLPHLVSRRHHCFIRDYSVCSPPSGERVLQRSLTIRGIKIMFGQQPARGLSSIETPAALNKLDTWRKPCFPRKWHRRVSNLRPAKLMIGSCRELCRREEAALGLLC